MPIAPDTISSQSRKKLKTFHYRATTLAAQDKENAPAPTTSHDGDQLTDDEHDTELSDTRFPFPQTPGSRISFADLIANPEDALDKSISATPNEQVEWKHVPGSSGISGSMRPSQRGKKRAYSSSPISSQTARVKNVELEKNSLDLESVGRSLRTPKQDDPAQALWNRYADVLERADQGDPILPPLPPLSSSPHTPGNLQRTDGFRRTASCGIEWPVSASKRRKTTDQDPHHKIKGIFAMNKNAILGKENTRHSRVSMLVDSIHQSLMYRTVPSATAPSSSSPVPDRQGSFQASPVKSLPPALLPHITEVHEREVEDDKTRQDEGSSDFGDIELDLDDLDLLQVLEQASTQKPPTDPEKQDTPSQQTRETRTAKVSSTANHGDITSISGSQRLDSKHLSTAVANTSVPLNTNNENNFDEFDDCDDDEGFTTELAELANEIDSQDPATVASKPTQSARQPSNLAKSEFDDAFDDNDDDDDGIWNLIDSTAAQAAPSLAGSRKQPMKDTRAIKRYLIARVFEGQYETSRGQKRPEKMLSIKDEKTQSMYIVLLRQSWYDTRCTKGSYIHLIGDFDSRGQCVVDDNDNMIILHPDHLVSATVVADSFTCTRRAILQDRIKATNPAEPPQVYGHFLHEVFGEALKRNTWEMDDLRTIIQQLIPSYIESLYEIGVEPVTAVEYAMSKMPELKGWASVFVSSTFVSDAVIRDRNGAMIPMTINKLLELEEHVWSPMFGLKGNIDATVQAQMQLATDRAPRTLTVPLELKTGKRDSNEMHRAQTALYTLLLSDRYDINVTSGILYYLETTKTFRVEGVRNEIRHMIIQRNELACYIHDKLALPPMIKKEHLCKKCYAQTSCFTYHKLVENGDAESSGLKELFIDAVGHLKPSQQEFFRKWDDLLTKEERDAMKFRRELWTMLSTEREAVGRCFANVMIEPGSATENTESPKINRYSYTFLKRKCKPGFSFAESQITVGEPIVISDEQGHFALANGYVTKVRPKRITVAVDRRLQNARIRQPGFHPETNQVFSSIMDVAGTQGRVQLEEDHSDTPILYRIDKDEFANGMATARNNVLRIMEKGLFRARELRELIVEHKAPAFKQTSTAYTISGPASQQNLNVDQRRAIEKVMSAKDYALVLGMPGTGKTTTIAHIIRALVAQGKSVLLTSYTHTAVDNILLKIKDDNIPILRLGTLGKVHPDVQKFADLSGIPKKTMSELEQSWSKSKVVATTCLGINHAIFNHRIFDYCIVDEASQITLPVCLGPIRLATTFILVGDHYQLPPLVQNKQAQEGGLDVSLFKLLSESQPSSVVNLEHQYRMAEDIMVLSNMLVYDGRLKCGTPAVASRTLAIPNLRAGLEAYHHNASSISRSTQVSKICIPGAAATCWLEAALNPQNRTSFLNTDTLAHESRISESGAREVHSRSGTRITNPTEAALIAQILATMVRSGVPPKTIGVITFYRSQLALLKSTVKSVIGTTAFSDIEMHTADKYQGRDKEVILLSCVRSNSACNVGELLKDWRRVNVAITRARSKLIVIGSAKTLKGSRVPILEGLIRIVNQKGWLLDLPSHAMEAHLFEGVPGTQTQSQFISPQKKNRSSSQSPRKTDTALSSDRVPLGVIRNVGHARGSVSHVGTKKPGKVADGSTMAVAKVLENNPVMKNVYYEILDDD